MLINDFYTFHDLVSEEGSLSCRIIFNASHPIFSGHFPGQPVVPGVCTLEVVKELLQNELGLKLILRNAHNVKFLQFLIPDMQPHAIIKWKKVENGAYSVTAQLTIDGAAAFKLDGKYEVAEAV